MTATRRGQIFWISFASEAFGALGAIILEADSATHALARTKELGINPGGEAKIIPMPADEPELDLFPREALISPSELRYRGYRSQLQMSETERAEIRRIDREIGVVTLCEDCNERRRA